MAISLDMRSDNWLRSQISKLEKRNQNIGDSFAMGGMMGGMTGAASSLAGGIFDKKIKKYQALLDSRTAAQSSSSFYTTTSS